MVITLKNKNELAKMKDGGKILAGVMEEVKKAAKPGVTTLELDALADRLISQKGDPCFKRVRDYKWASCLCVNDVVVHGIPNNYKLKENDLLGIDIGMLYQGFITDMSETIIVDDVILRPKAEESHDKIKFLSVGKLALEKAIAQAKPGNRVGHISQAIGETITKAGFFPVPSLVGHGVGLFLHEEPQIPGLLKEEIEKTPLLITGMTLAIEIIYNQGNGEIVYKNNDGWTISTASGGLSGLFEKTVAITNDGPEVLT